MLLIRPLIFKPTKASAVFLIFLSMEIFILSLNNLNVQNVGNITVHQIGSLPSPLLLCSDNFPGYLPALVVLNKNPSLELGHPQ